jgi:cytochrome c5
MPHYTPPTVPVPSRLLVLVAGAFAAAAPARAADPIGAEACKACHPAAYEGWRDGPHATAQVSLPERSRADARCTACHAPLQARGGAAVSGVTCETCHGNGQLYARRYVMRDRELARALGLLDVGEKTCVRCHDEAAPSLARFDFARKGPIVEHGAADRQARRAAEGAAPAARTP